MAFQTVRTTNNNLPRTQLQLDSNDMSATGLQGNQVVGAGDHAAHAHAPSGGGLIHFLRSYVFSTDHKIIGLQFLFSTLIWSLCRWHVGHGHSLAAGLALAEHADRGTNAL